MQHGSITNIIGLVYSWLSSALLTPTPLAPTTLSLTRAASNVLKAAMSGVDPAHKMPLYYPQSLLCRTTTPIGIINRCVKCGLLWLTPFILHITEHLTTSKTLQGINV
jgi:hypothetical protein